MICVIWLFIFVMSSKFVNYFNQYNNVIKLDNPISTDLDIMRPSIIPNLLESINKNQARFFNDAGIFEVGPQYQNYNIIVFAIPEQAKLNFYRP